MSLQIDCAIPGGNIIVKSIGEFEAHLRRDIRDTEGDWFYWEFRAIFEKKGKYTFRFDTGCIGTRGPALSCDAGLTWEWLGRDRVNYANHSFVYEYDGTKSSTIIFCGGMQYQSANLDVFLTQHAASPLIVKTALCQSRKRRTVELIKIADPTLKSKRKLLLTSRHHCGEMMANYVLEGILAEALENVAFRAMFAIFAVPFVDKDGVVDGDQGKNRRPHDHARDYGKSAIYPETKAIMKLVKAERFDLILDIHCPWLYGTNNENIYFVGPKSKRFEVETLRLARILTEEAAGLAVFSGDVLLFGSSWNTAANYKSGKTLRDWSAGLDFVTHATSIEIPFANAGETTLSADLMRRFGRRFARALLKYGQLTFPERKAG